MSWPPGKGVISHANNLKQPAFQTWGKHKAAWERVETMGATDDNVRDLAFALGHLRVQTATIRGLRAAIAWAIDRSHPRRYRTQKDAWNQHRASQRHFMYCSKKLKAAALPPTPPATSEPCSPSVGGAPTDGASRDPTLADMHLTPPYSPAGQTCPCGRRQSEPPPPHEALANPSPGRADDLVSAALEEWIEMGCHVPHQAEKLPLEEESIWAAHRPP
jgi:hypothetical protein